MASRVEPCPFDCDGQRYPSFPYKPGAESLFSTALPIILSAMVVVISWLAGRFIDQIKVTAQQGGMPRVKSLKRCVSNDKDFHSSRGGPMSTASVQELEGISLADDEGRLYNETYGSEHSRDDGDRYDALGDSPGAQGPSSQGPRSPSVYSQFSQSVFSQSAYGPSAYGPSQRRPSGVTMLGVPGSQIGSSTYDVTSSHAGSGASQYAGPVPSNLGASHRSGELGSLNGSGGGVGGVTGIGVGVGYAHNHAHVPYGSGLQGRSMGSGPLGSGPLGSVGGGSGGIGGVVPVSGRRLSGPIAAPPYNPNANPMMIQSGGGSGRIAKGMIAGGASGIGGGRGVGGAVLGYPAANRGSPPSYSQAQANMVVPASVLPREPRPSVDSYTQPTVPDDQSRAVGGIWRTAVVAAAPIGGGGAASAPVASDEAGGAEPDNHRPQLHVRAPAVRAGPQSGFGSDSEYDGGLGTPSTFRA